MYSTPNLNAWLPLCQLRLSINWMEFCQTRYGVGSVVSGRTAFVDEMLRIDTVG